MDPINILKADADLLTMILNRCEPPYETNGPGWGPASIKALEKFAEDAVGGNVHAYVTLPTASPLPATGGFGEAIAAVAETQIGTEEDAAHTNRGSAILKYQQATSLDGQGWPWCAAFVDWCFKQAASQVATGVSRPKTTLARPETASAFGLIDWAHSQKMKVFTPADGKPQRGDIVVYNFSHTGIVTGFTSGTTFAAVEGNTDPMGGSDGYAVARKTRLFSLVRAFIRV